MAHAHHHHHGGGSDLSSSQTRQILTGIVVGITVAAVVGLIALRPTGDRVVLDDELGFSAELVDATVTSAIDVPCANTLESDGIRCLEVAFDVTSGSVAGETGSFQLPATEALVPIGEGDGIVVAYEAAADPAFAYRFNDFQRQQPLLLLGAIFAVAVVALGRWQGLRALAGLAITGAVLMAFVVPAVLEGRNPTTVALVAAVLMALAALYLAHGVTDMTTVALLGTFSALGLAAGLAFVFSELASFTGFATEDAFFLRLASAEIDIKGLVLAGIIIGTLGVLDDVTVTQVSAVWQLHEANPTYGPRELYRSGIRIGRDHIASTVNTLVLAYAGASLPLLLLYTQAGRSLVEVATGELVAVEVVRTLVGSIGLVAAVPITTALAAFVVTRQPTGAAAPDVDDGDGDANDERKAPPEPPPSAPAARQRAADEAPRPEGEAPEAAWEQFAPDDPKGW